MVLEKAAAAEFSKFMIVSFNSELLNILQNLFIVLNHFEPEKTADIPLRTTGFPRNDV